MLAPLSAAYTPTAFGEAEPHRRGHERAAPARASIHHLKLPVTDLARSRQWHRSRLGYQVQMEFVEQGQLMGCALSHTQRRPRSWACSSIPNAPGPPRDSATSAQECGTEPVAYLSEAPVMSAYALEDGTVYLAYSTTARGLEFMMGYYGFLNRTPLGRDEGHAPMRWMRRHDECGTRT
jgi:predicted dithiol-disulfide oxidoreductase (DUF899 family)